MGGQFSHARSLTTHPTGLRFHFLVIPNTNGSTHPRAGRSCFTGRKEERRRQSAGKHSAIPELSCATSGKEKKPQVNHRSNDSRDR